MAALRVDERFVDALAVAVADRAARRLEALRGEGAGLLDTDAAARYLGTTRRRIHELTSARVLRPDGQDGRRPLYRRSSLDRYVKAGGGGDGR
jgi:Helix-turn-helix domain